MFKLTQTSQLKKKQIKLYISGEKKYNQKKKFHEKKLEKKERNEKKLEKKEKSKKKIKKNSSPQCF